MDITPDIKKATEEALDSKEGFFLVSAETKSGGEILVEVDNDLRPISLEEIITLTREIKDAVGEERLGDYDLTVSSAGLTAPLRLPRQYRKFLGKELSVLQKNGIKETGLLKSADDEGITLEVKRKVKVEGKKRKVEEAVRLLIPYTEIKTAVYDLKV